MKICVLTETASLWPLKVCKRLQVSGSHTWIKLFLSPETCMESITKWQEKSNSICNCLVYLMAQVLFKLYMTLNGNCWINLCMVWHFREHTRNFPSVEIAMHKMCAVCPTCLLSVPLSPPGITFTFFPLSTHPESPAGWLLLGLNMKSYFIVHNLHIHLVVSKDVS